MVRMYFCYSPRLNLKGKCPLPLEIWKSVKTRGRQWRTVNRRGCTMCMWILSKHSYPPAKQILWGSLRFVLLEMIFCRQNKDPKAVGLCSKSSQLSQIYSEGEVRIMSVHASPRTGPVPVLGLPNCVQWQWLLTHYDSFAINSIDNWWTETLVTNQQTNLLTNYIQQSNFLEVSVQEISFFLWHIKFLCRAQKSPLFVFVLS